jgi:hypothetical protein
MSYILDAIRKSDWERRRGQVPGVLDRHGAASPVAADGDRSIETAWTSAPGWVRPLSMTILGGAVAGAVGLAVVSLAPEVWRNRDAQPAALAALPPAMAPAAASGVPAVQQAADPAAVQTVAAVNTAGAVTPPAGASASALPAPQPPMVVVPPGTGWALLPMVPAGAVAGSGGVAGVPMAMAAPGMVTSGDWGAGMAANVDLTDEEIAALLDSHGAPRPAPTGVSARTGARAAATEPPKADLSARRKPGADRGDEPAWYANARADLASMAAAEKAKARGIGAGASTLAARSSAVEAPEPVLAALPPPAAAGPGRVTSAVRPTAAPPIDELPAAVREQLPAIALSVHIYADQPAARRVRVNNVAVHEGDTIGAGLDVAAITRDGVIFRFRGTEFFLPANESWQPQSAAAR